MTAVRVQGNRLVDQAGREVVLRGVSHSGSEYTCVHGKGVFEGTMDSSFVAGLKSWKNLNAVRLPLNEDCWLGINGVGSGGDTYQDAYMKAVELLTSANIAVLADLHWTAPGTSKATGQQQLPDRDHAPKMWSEVATAFRNNPLVIFELFNEPFLGNSDAKAKDWICWANGTQCSGIHFQPAGQAELLQSVRATGASNVVLMGGMAWSNDLSHWLEYAPYMRDPIHQSAAVWHSYANNACNRQSCWDRTIKSVADHVPVVVTEMGHGISWAQGLMKWIEIQGGTISYLPWTWNTWGAAAVAAVSAEANSSSRLVASVEESVPTQRSWGAGEALVKNYTTGEPTDWGKAVKDSFANAKVGVPSA